MKIYQSKSPILLGLIVISTLCMSCNTNPPKTFLDNEVIIKMKKQIHETYDIMDKEVDKLVAIIQKNEMKATETEEEKKMRKDIANGQMFILQRYQLLKTVKPLADAFKYCEYRQGTIDNSLVQTEKRIEKAGAQSSLCTNKIVNVHTSYYLFLTYEKSLLKEILKVRSVDYIDSMIGKYQMPS